MAAAGGEQLSAQRKAPWIALAVAVLLLAGCDAPPIKVAQEPSLEVVDAQEVTLEPDGTMPRDTLEQGDWAAFEVPPFLLERSREDWRRACTRTTYLFVARIEPDGAQTPVDTGVSFAPIEEVVPPSEPPVCIGQQQASLPDFKLPLGEPGSTARYSFELRSYSKLTGGQAASTPVFLDVHTPGDANQPSAERSERLAAVPAPEPLAARGLASKGGNLTKLRGASFSLKSLQPSSKNSYSAAGLQRSRDNYAMGKIGFRLSGPRKALRKLPASLRRAAEIRAVAEIDFRRQLGTSSANPYEGAYGKSLIALKRGKNKACMKLRFDLRDGTGSFRVSAGTRRFSRVKLSGPLSGLRLGGPPSEEVDVRVGKRKAPKAPSADCTRLLRRL